MDGLLNPKAYAQFNHTLVEYLNLSLNVADFVNEPAMAWPERLYMMTERSMYRGHVLVM